MVGRRAVWAGLCFLMCGSGCVTFIPAGSVGVKWTPGGVSSEVYREGSAAMAPWDNLTTYDARSQEHDEKLEVLAINGLRITLDASIRYHIVPDEVVGLHREVGPDFYSILLGPTLRSQARRVVGRYTPEEIYSTQREAIEKQIREGIEKALEGKHVQLEAVLIRGVALPQEIQQAINDKLQAEQQSLKEKFLIETTKQEAARAQIQAQSEADRAKTKAQGDADAQRIAAQAQADANSAIDKSLTDKTLKWKQLDATAQLATSPNSKVIVLPEGKTTPLLQLQ